MKFATARVAIAVIAVAVSVFAASSAVLAQSKSDSGTKPGWGYGDKKHPHTGPPGQSVRPGGTQN